MDEPSWECIRSRRSSNGVAASRIGDISNNQSRSRFCSEVFLKFSEAANIAPIFDLRRLLACARSIAKMQNDIVTEHRHFTATAAALGQNVDSPYLWEHLR